MRWVWIDRFTEFESGRRAVAVKSLSMAEEFFGEHFPHYPVMPASLFLEGLAQTGGILVGEARQFKENVVLGKIAKGRFLREVFPGERLTYTAEMQFINDGGASIQGTIHSGGELVAEAEIFFGHVPDAQMKQALGDAWTGRNFVFDGELKHLLGHVPAKQEAAKA